MYTYVHLYIFYELFFKKNSVSLAVFQILLSFLARLRWQVNLRIFIGQEQLMMHISRRS